MLLNNQQMKTCVSQNIKLYSNVLQNIKLTVWQNPAISTGKNLQNPAISACAASAACACPACTLSENQDAGATPLQYPLCSNESDEIVRQNPTISTDKVLQNPVTFVCVTSTACACPTCITSSTMLHPPLPLLQSPTTPPVPPPTAAPATLTTHQSRYGYRQ